MGHVKSAFQKVNVQYNNSHTVNQSFIKKTFDQHGEETKQDKRKTKARGDLHVSSMSKYNGMNGME